MQQIAVEKAAYNEYELPLAIGCSKRAARQIVKQLGVRIGARRIVPREKLLQWLEQQPRAADKCRAERSPTLDLGHEFKIR